MRTFCEDRLPPDGTLLDGTFRMHALDGSHIATTLRLYAHTLSEQQDRAAEAIGAVMAGRGLTPTDPHDRP